MKQSLLFTHTLRETPKDEVSLNAQLLIRAGFVDKLMSGVYSYLPLGLRVLDKIKAIIREEMNAINGQEILMPALTPKENWEKTGRWKDLDVLFRLTGQGEKEYALGSTHEEVVTPLLQKFVKSYKDLPVAVYQIQDKFRDEPRAKSGLLRGREFNMKDLYSFHADEADLDQYYETAKQAYGRIFSRCGLDSLVVEASGGSFSKFSDEFQVRTENGEDEIYFCAKCQRHQNKELVPNGELTCPYCGSEREVVKTIEVGNIFKLKTKYTEPFGFVFTDQKGETQPVLMGCYGIGPSRVLGAVVETSHDEKGIIWPENLAPFKYHLISLVRTEAEQKQVKEIYSQLQQNNREVLYDDREVSAGEKFKDADLIGLPWRIVISEKTLTQESVEITNRSTGETKMMKIKDWLSVC